MLERSGLIKLPDATFVANKSVDPACGYYEDKPPNWQCSSGYDNGGCIDCRYETGCSWGLTAGAVAGAGVSIILMAFPT